MLLKLVGSGYVVSVEKITLFLPFSAAPTIALSDFHLTILNSSGVEVTWRPPSSSIGINGNLRGFKLFVDKVDGNQTIIDIPGSLNRVYIVAGLEESATYLFSMLMYTVGDGPHSVRLQVTMPNASEYTVATVLTPL